ncbi:MAG: hypothetical protein IT342_17580 [Candidatus Melainabacteria bacterium]|nr:hypothetical protein [Candidatus Melainabacteria bacterium]
MAKDARVKALLSSYVLLGFFMLLAVDFGFRVADNYFHLTNPLDSPNRSLIWYSVNAFANEQTAPDIALLGSSLMMTAHHAGDATKINAMQNEVSHFHSSCLENFLAGKIGHKPTSFSFAIAGQMASDAYLITRSLLAGKKQPKVIIYGIAPRDLIDNTLPSPASTETFKFLSRNSDFSDIALSARYSLNEYLQFGLEKAFYTLSHKANLVAMQHRCAYSVAPYGMNAITVNELTAPFKLRQIARRELPDDNGANELRVGPYGAECEPFRDNTDEYRQRYACIKNKTYVSQLSYLEDLMKLTREKGIQLAVVNMPLTTSNVSLMPKGFYDRYKNTLSGLAAANGASFLDLNRADVFDQKHFADTVHLNGLGGVEFFKLLSNELALNRSFGAALSRTH